LFSEILQLALFQRLNRWAKDPGNHCMPALRLVRGISTTDREIVFDERQFGKSLCAGCLGSSHDNAGITPFRFGPFFPS
jgi:hypothetical protein